MAADLNLAKVMLLMIGTCVNEWEGCLGT